MKSKIFNFVLIMISINYCLSIAGCGQSGPLVLPPQVKSTSTTNLTNSNNTTTNNGRYSSTTASSSPKTVT